MVVMRRAFVVVGLCAVVAGCGSSSSDDDRAPAAARDTGVQAAAAPGADHADRDRAAAEAEADAKPKAGGDGVLRGTYTRLNGVRTDLAGYRGDVVLVVNTATECGFTPQFEGLEALYRERRSEGLVVLGFPANDFAGQEPRSDKEIAQFCKANYGVTFPMFAKTTVVGGKANPLFRSLTRSAGAPEWNFNKYLVDRSGKVVARFGAGTEPDGPELKQRLDALL